MERGIPEPRSRTIPGPHRPRVIRPATVLAAAVLVSVLGLTATAAAQPRDGTLSPRAALGKRLFFDETLSIPPGQSCASCHSASAGFTFPNSQINQTLGVAPGVIPGRFGFRAVPQISYAAFGPAGPPFLSHELGVYVGGLFWDGHADTLEDQARFPFLNPNEMNNLTHGVGDPGLVVNKVRTGRLATQFEVVYGSRVFSRPVPEVYRLITEAIAEYEKSKEVSPFSSRFDAWRAGRAQLTDQELLGLRIMTGSWSGRPDGATFPVFAHCMDCHMVPSIPSASPDLWTNTCYQNIGVPRNGNNPFYRMTDKTTNPVGYNPLGRSFVDYGLGATIYTRMGLPPGNVGRGSDGRGDFLGVNGLFKAPSLRNVDRRPGSGFVKAYMHNGALKSLEEVVHFYNTRNLTTQPGEVIDFTRDDPYEGLGGRPLWGPPEHPTPDTLVNPDGVLGSLPGTGSGGESGAQVGNLGLSPDQEAAIVAFLRTLSDGYFDPDSGHEGCIWITSQPVAQRVCLNGSVRFTVASGGAEALTYQWRHNGIPIPGEVISYYTIVVATAADAGQYDCIVTSACGQVTSLAAELFICISDVNCDGRSDLNDYLAFLAAFRRRDASADLNGDGQVDQADLAAFLSAYRGGC